MTESAEAPTVDLPATIFDVQVNVPLIHQVVVAQQAAARQGTADTKNRGEVRGGGRKPYKQKGTGRARQGSVRAPQFAGGGIVHGPTPRGYDQRTPKKMKAAALRGALSDRARSQRVHVVESFVTGETPSTRSALSALAGLTDNGLHGPRTLVVLERGDNLTWLSLRNVDTVHLLAVDQLNTYDVLLCDDVVFTKAAFDTFVSGAPGGATTTIAVSRPTETAVPAEPTQPTEPTEPTEPEADEPADAGTGESPSSAEPLADGSAPEGYDIKGNKGSMKFHAPGGRWYDATTAEVWFKTAADAEAAGFVEAGKKAAKPAEQSAEETGQ